MNEDVFLSVLRENPTDDVTWQALADWLDDDGQGERAELLRLTRRMRNLPLDGRGVQRQIEALLRAGVEPVRVEMVNAIGMRFVLIQEGTFLMGSPADEEDRNDDEQQHEVTLTRPFWLGVYPVTQGQWKKVIRKNPSYFSRRGQGKDSVKDVSDADLDLFPVESVSWEDAQAFLKKLAALDEEAKNRREYRLPSEAEWEYACRGGHLIQHPEDGRTLPFHFDQPTSSLDSTQANFDGNYPYGGAGEGPYLQRPSKVGTYKPNRLGLYDMHGNVWEWCRDWYAPYPSTPVADPVGPPEGSVRVFRGGCWVSRGGRSCRAAYRVRDSPSLRNRGVGFRAALVLSSG